jgi:hypothetical protein
MPRRRTTPRPGGVPAARPVAIALAVIVTALLLAPGASAEDELTVQVYPRRAYASPGAPIRFTASVFDSDGGHVPAGITWMVIPPRVGTIDADGRFVAGSESGRAIIRAIASLGDETGAGHSVVEVNATPPARLEVTVEPRRAAVEPDGIQQFDATVSDPSTGDPVEAELRWVVIPEALGAIDGDGLFSAGSEEGSGRVAVRATADEREGVGDASVVVGTPPGAGVTVSVVPMTALVGPGSDFQFTAVVTDESGGPVDAPVEWSVMPRRLGVVSPTGSSRPAPKRGQRESLPRSPRAAGPSAASRASRSGAPALPVSV